MEIKKAEMEMLEAQESFKKVLLSGAGRFSKKYSSAVSKRSEAENRWQKLIDSKI